MDLNGKEDIRISIVLPVYNGENYIERAIRSVLQQKYSNYELIIVDDGSTDKTDEVLRKYEEEKRIRVVKKRNGGVSSARNIGLTYITGDYLLFLDSDDELTSDCLMTLASHVKHNKDTDLIVFGWKELGEKDRIRRVTEEKELIATDFIIEKIIETEFECGGGYPWNKLWRIDSLKRNTVIQPFNEELILCEDKEWAVRQLLNCKRAMLIPDVLYLYYIINEEHLSKISFNAVEPKNDNKVISFAKASIGIEEEISRRKPDSELSKIANKKCMQDIILVYYKSIRNRNDNLRNQVTGYFRKYVENKKKSISVKYWVMLWYIRANLILERINKTIRCN